MKQNETIDLIERVTEKNGIIEKHLNEFFYTRYLLYNGVASL